MNFRSALPVDGWERSNLFEIEHPNTFNVYFEAVERAEHNQILRRTLIIYDSNDNDVTGREGVGCERRRQRRRSGLGRGHTRGPELASYRRRDVSDRFRATPR